MIKRRLAAVLLTVLVIVTLPTLATVASASTEPTVSGTIADSPGCLVFVPFHCDPHPKAVSPGLRFEGVRYHEGDGSDGNDGGNYGDNDNRRCHNSENCRGSFSPGPFDRSPVDIHDNCISPDCSRHSEDNKDKEQPKK